MGSSLASDPNGQGVNRSRLPPAPCAPDSVRVRVRLIDGMQLAMATWPAVACRAPVKYLVSLEGRIQDDPRARVDLWSYPTDRLYYEFPVPCSTVFNLTVRSVNGGGVSVAGPHFHGLTGEYVAERSTDAHV